VCKTTVFCKVIANEFLVIFHRIKVALDKGNNRIIIESNSKERVEYLHRGTTFSCAFCTLLSDIFRLRLLIEAIEIAFDDHCEATKTSIID
jgi:hypothetical protein